MDLDLRQAVLQNISNKNEDQLVNMVETAIADGEEKTLPGLGVIFEVMWKNTDDKVHQELIESLSENV